jgi:uncharacterized protein
VSQIPIAPDVFTMPPEEPHLVGSTCQGCNATTFPVSSACPRCSSTSMERRVLPRRGTLVSWTTQSFLPKEPYAGGETEETFRPYGVGLVQLDDLVRVEARLTEADTDKLSFGMLVETVLVPLRTEGDGTEVLMHAFAPVKGD